MDWPNPVRLILYLLGLGYTFLGVAVISDVFMNGIEKITSSKKRITDKKTGKKMTVYVWNATVANLTLMALGSSAPEILLSLIEITFDEFFLGPLGAGTIVGSAAFNLLMISAACVLSIPDGEVRYIKEMHVYFITASCSVFAYLWLMFILMVTSPDVCEIWEAVLTLLFCPMLVFFAYLADRGYFKKKEEREEIQSHHDETISDDASPEELAEIEAHIREIHGNTLTNEQIVKIMRVEYFGKHSRAWYRHQAMAQGLHGKTVDTTPIAESAERVKQVLDECGDDIDSEKAASTVIMEFETNHRIFAENCDQAEVVVIRRGFLQCKAMVNYKTVEGTALFNEDFIETFGTLTFESGETAKSIFIKIVDDNTFEPEEHFFVDLSEPKCENSRNIPKLGKNLRCMMDIVDDDEPGELSFEQEDMEIEAPGAEGKPEVVEFTVLRKNGRTGKVSCSFKTDNMDAVAGVHYEEAKGKVTFEDQQEKATIAITLTPAQRPKALGFNIVIESPEGGIKFDEHTDGGEESCICHVKIKPDTSCLFASMKDRIHSANAIVGHKNWAAQFYDAIFEVGDGDDEEEEGEEGGESSGPSKFDYFMHVIGIPWKLLFAFVPPVDYLGGWACFCTALMFIAVVTAIVGDMANLVGCCLDILPEDCAITFVALGTSLPDTFASMTAAKMDPYADASIGNVTGSNSVNVFLGVGIAWALAAFKWQPSKPTDEWMKRTFSSSSTLTSAQQDNVMDMVKGGDTAVFVTPAGSLWFNLMVFSVNAFFALQHLMARRKKWGGELGGPKKGFFGQYFSAGFLGFQWFIYVGASIVFAHMNGGATYGDLAD